MSLSVSNGVVARGFRKLCRPIVVSLAVLFPVILATRLGLVAYLVADARRALTSQNFADAQSSLRIAGILDPNNSRVVLLHARIERHLEDYVGATSSLLQAKRLGIGAETVQFERLLAHAQQGQLNDASIRSKDLLSDPCVDPVEVCEAFVRGAFRRDDSKLLYSLLNHWSEISPNDPRQFLLRGRMWEENQSWQAAEAAYRVVLQLDQNNTPGKFGLAICLMQQSRFHDALRQYESILKAEPNNTTAIVGRAKCHSELGDLGLAKKLFLEVLQRDPQDFIARLELGRLEFAQNQFKKAVFWLKPLAQQYPYDLDVRYHLAMALRADGHHEQALEHFHHLETLQQQLVRSAKLMDKIRTDPGDLDARYELGTTVLKHFEPARGLYWLNTVLARNPSHEPTHQALSEYYEQRGESRLAAQHRKFANYSNTHHTKINEHE